MPNWSRISCSFAPALRHWRLSNVSSATSRSVSSMPCFSLAAASTFAILGSVVVASADRHGTSRSRLLWRVDRAGHRIDDISGARPEAQDLAVGHVHEAPVLAGRGDADGRFRFQ